MIISYQLTFLNIYFPFLKKKKPLNLRGTIIRFFVCSLLRHHDIIDAIVRNGPVDSRIDIINPLDFRRNPVGQRDVSVFLLHLDASHRMPNGRLNRSNCFMHRHLVKPDAIKLTFNTLEVIVSLPIPDIRPSYLINLANDQILWFSATIIGHGSTVVLYEFCGHIAPPCICSGGFVQPSRNFHQTSKVLCTSNLRYLYFTIFT